MLQEKYCTSTAKGAGIAVRLVIKNRLVTALANFTSSPKSRDTVCRFWSSGELKEAKDKCHISVKCHSGVGLAKLRGARAMTSSPDVGQRVGHAQFLWFGSHQVKKKWRVHPLDLTECGDLCELQLEKERRQIYGQMSEI